jgi:hypothetical protein
MLFCLTRDMAANQETTRHAICQSEDDCISIFVCSACLVETTLTVLRHVDVVAR